MEPDSLNVPRRTLTEILYVIFLRMIALICFWFGLQYWAMLVGYSLHGMARFDLLSLPWKVAASSLAVLFPVASLGLWLAVSWGPVLWAIAAVTQVLMYMVWPEIFGYNRLVPLMHGLVAALYIVFRLSLWIEARRKAERVRIDLP
ncbi:DUF6163 family protein [Neorhizobium sp. Rsf11]|uniref:DUF6163 family protein n=2 Tax=Neorhizobium TaxID=1525371 RepID=A0ABV0M0S7_9HYPH|nr:DUF6163 family protein [Neorhizobium petrolearium]MCC2609278.1 DUF6163 family protein [Neorhizobium petrolearium]WGI69500.1 DUF6163 family protein [Neorhizobium petrolearium]